MKHLKKYKLFEAQTTIERIIINNKLDEFIELMDDLDQHNINQTLIITANLDNVDMTKILLNDYKADPNHIDEHFFKNKYTALLRSSDFDIMKILLESGADVNHLALNGRNILMYEASYDDSNTFHRISQLLDLFLEYGLNMSLTDNDGKDFIDYLDGDIQVHIKHWLNENYKTEYDIYMKNKATKKFKI